MANGAHDRGSSRPRWGSHLLLAAQALNDEILGDLSLDKDAPDPQVQPVAKMVPISEVAV